MDMFILILGFAAAAISFWVVGEEVSERRSINKHLRASICINTRVGGTYANDDSSCAHHNGLHGHPRRVLG